MSLTEQLASQTTVGTVRDASRLVGRNCVYCDVRDREFLQGSVYSGQAGTKDVVICLDGDRIEKFTCSCGHASAEVACCHVYAVALVSEQLDPALAAPGYRKEPTPVWQRQLRALQKIEFPEPRPVRRPHAEPLLYLVDIRQCLQQEGLAIRIARQRQSRSGPRIKDVNLDAIHLGTIADPIDRRILAAMRGGADHAKYGFRYGIDPCTMVDPGLWEVLVPDMASCGRLFIRQEGEDGGPGTPIGPLQWDDGPPWEFMLRTTRDDLNQVYRMCGLLVRGTDEIDLKAPLMCLMQGLVFFHDRAARLSAMESFPWLAALRDIGQIAVPFNDAGTLLQELLRLPSIPRLEMPDELRMADVVGQPRPQLMVRASRAGQTYPNKLRGELSFGYGQHVIAEGGAARVIVDVESRTILRRDASAEAALAGRLRDAGFTEYRTYDGSHEWLLTRSKLPSVVNLLLGDGWQVQAEGKLYRRAGGFRDVEVASGIDWFELRGQVDFEGQSVQLPALLEAVRKGQETIVLDDGSMGMIPEDWLKKYALLAGTASVQDGRLRFRRCQAMLLDTLLAAEPQVQVDEIFSRTRDALRQFSGVLPQEPSPDFTGQLRPYQREALGWFDFLRQFGFGGCLADDMGLGKTVQVLAMLDSRRCDGSATGPSLVVVPRSLVFNWLSEAQKFTPRLKVLDHTTPQREKTVERLQDYHLVLCTYGTLVRDIPAMKDVMFDHVVLDEAHAIKNSSTDTAKAVRLLKATHRLGLSGTPIQNHLGELWSMFEFLNPGLLGAASVFSRSVGKTPDPQTREALSRAMRPFILRRTKQQVATELPDRTEQTIFCEMEPAQQRQYEQLRDHYRAALLGTIDRKGINRSRIEILEALLRLRQAAIHPGLIDKRRVRESSAKLETLMDRVVETVGEGHKTLVFSQFVSMLSIVRDRLTRRNIRYAYLDGKTRDRQAAVREFQDDPECKLFLISLKAGGLGLNLTAAEYVFLLDPWWNPAVEAQAIDRAHRIGQERHVFAYRIITQGTVEEKVLQLQQAKRDLADAIITADNSLVSKLGREDLELLLS